MRKKRTFGQNGEINLAMTELRLSNFQTSLREAVKNYLADFVR